MEVLLERLKQARAGHGGLLLVRGAAGVGKTRLLTETLTAAGRLGFRVLSGRADELDRGLPYAALREALAPGLAAETDAEVAPLAEQVQRHFGFATGIEPRADLSVDVGMLHAAFGVGERLLRAWAHRDPVVLGVDDLHAADAETLAAVTVLARTMRSTRLLVIATVRPDPPDLDRELSAHLDRLADRDGADFVDLAELDDDDVRALMTTRLAANPDDALVDRVVGMTRGNPFYVEELLRAYDAARAVEVVDGRASLGPGVDEVSLTTRGALLQRVLRLGSDAWTVARCLTALQRVSVDRLDVIAEVTGLPQAAVDRAFDLLVGARILDRVAGGEYAFAHPILRANLDADLGPAERHRFNRLIARALRDRQRAGHQVDPLELAAYVAQSIEPGDAEVTAILMRAGDLTARFAPRSAADWYGRVLETLPADSPQRGPVVAKRARALFLAQRKAEAARDARTALQLLPGGADRERAAVVLAGSLSALGETQQALEVTDAEVPVSERAPRLLAERASLLVQLDRFDEAEETARTAARHATEPGAHALAVSALAQAAFARGDAIGALELLDAELQRVADDAAPSMVGIRIARASWLSYAGQCDTALAALEEAEASAARLGGGAFRTSIDPPAVWALWLAGRWDEALRRARAAATEFERAGELFLLPLVRVAEAAILTERGEVGKAREILAVLPETRSTRLPVAWASAAAHLATGRFDAARSVLTTAIERSRNTGRLQFLPQLRERLISVELAAGDVEAAARQLAHLEAELAGFPAIPWARAMAERAAAMVRRDAAAATRAADAARAASLTFDAAVADLLAGELGADPQALQRAYEVFRDLGAEPWRRRAKSALRAGGHRVPNRKASARRELTDTERQLARLVSDGLTNREIARAVFLSPKTVEAYLSRLYTKMGCGSRLELAVAVRSGVVDVDSPVGS